MKLTSHCGKLVTDYTAVIDAHNLQCMECAAIVLKKSRDPGQPELGDQLQVAFSAINIHGKAVEKREYLWQREHLGQMLKVADDMSVSNPAAVRLVIDIAFPKGG